MARNICFCAYIYMYISVKPWFCGVTSYMCSVRAELAMRATVIWILKVYFVSTLDVKVNPWVPCWYWIFPRLVNYESERVIINYRRIRGSCGNSNCAGLFCTTGAECQFTKQPILAKEWRGLLEPNPVDAWCSVLYYRVRIIIQQYDHSN